MIMVKCKIYTILTNHTSRPIVIPCNSFLCELHWCSQYTGAETPVKTQNIASCSANQSPDLLSSFDFSSSETSPGQLQQLQNLIKQYPNIFSLNDNDIGFTNRVKHHIELNDEVPFKQRPRRILPSMYDELRTHLQNLLDQSVIRKSHSSWCSNVVLVRKKTILYFYA